MGVDLNECTNTIKIEPDHQIITGEVSKWKPPLGTKTEVVIELDFKEDQTAAELVEAFTNGQASDNTLTDFTLSDETELLLTVRAQPCLLQQCHVNRRIDVRVSTVPMESKMVTSTTTSESAASAPQPLVEAELVT